MNTRYSITLTGSGHSGDEPNSIEQRLRKLLQQLDSNGHSIETASLLVGGKQVALKIHDRTIPVPLEKESQSVPDTANPALHVNTLLREVHEGVMTLLERTAPKPTKQPARKATEKKEGPPPAESVDPGNDSGSFTDF